MTKNMLRFLRFLTKKEIPDSILKTATDLKVKDNKFSFHARVKVDKKEWEGYIGGEI